MTGGVQRLPAEVPPALAGLPVLILAAEVHPGEPACQTGELGSLPSAWREELRRALGGLGLPVVVEPAEPHAWELGSSVALTSCEGKGFYVFKARTRLVARAGGKEIGRSDEEVFDGSMFGPSWRAAYFTQEAVARMLPSLFSGPGMLALSDRVKADPPGQAEEPGPIVAVFDIQDASGTRFAPEVREQLTEFLIAQVASRGFRVVPRDQLRSRLAEQKADSYRQCYDQGCQIELGRALAAQKSLAVKILVIEERCALTGLLYDLKSETAERATSIDSACSASALMDALKQLSGGLGSGG